MKKITLFILLFNWLLNHSQNPELTNRSWYLQSITINGTTTNTPFDPINFPFVELFFFNSTPSSFIASSNTQINEDCVIGFNGHVSHQSTSVFNFIDFSSFNNNSTCNNTIIDFMNSYINFFSSTISSTFNYAIIDDIDNSMKLTITNNANNVIVFSNKFYNSPPLHLVENQWYLHELIINGMSHTVPSSNCISNVLLQFYNSNFFTQAVSSLAASALFDYDNSLFYSYEFVSDYGMTLCGEPYDTFTDQYIGTFYLSNIPSGPFNYNVTDVGSTKKLTITNPQNNQAIYNNYSLSIDEENYYNLKIFPNPTRDFIVIEDNTDFKINNVEVLNILGQNIFTSDDKIIDFKNFENGLYNLKIITNDDRFIVKKVIKY